MVVVFALLIWSNYTLRRQHARSVAAVKSARAFAVHDSIDALPVVDLTGARGTLPFNGRTIVAIVDPRCDSCRELLGGIRPDGGTQVLSVAPLTETIAMAKATRLTAVTHALAEPPGGRIDPRTQIYPQLFVVEHGRVVRTCASVSECGTTTGPAPG
ncbi:MAG TPA: hypothetical protein VJ276_14685 [Thermoanaerobaculia bacterium]|nr:hypothetical protein [Thermoanaerobaculia bacterium]